MHVRKRQLGPFESYGCSKQGVWEFMLLGLGGQVVHSGVVRRGNGGGKVVGWWGGGDP